MNKTSDNNDLVSEFRLYDEELGGVTEDENQNPWKTISDCLKQMQWTDGHCGSPSPTPVNSQPVTPVSAQQQQQQPQQSQQQQGHSVATPFTKYRKSDGDLHAIHTGVHLKAQAVMNPPQSAPVVFEGGGGGSSGGGGNGEFMWDSSHPVVKSHLRSKSAQNVDPNLTYAVRSLALNKDTGAEASRSSLLISNRSADGSSSEHESFVRNSLLLSNKSALANNSGTTFLNPINPLDTTEAHASQQQPTSTFLPYAAMYGQRTSSPGLYHKQSSSSSSSNSSSNKDIMPVAVFQNQNVDYSLGSSTKFSGSVSAVAVDSHEEEEEKGYTKGKMLRGMLQHRI